MSVGEFRGTKNVGLREYYETDGLRPGKKGINLTVEQFNTLVDSVQVCSLSSVAAGAPPFWPFPPVLTSLLDTGMPLVWTV